MSRCGYGVVRQAGSTTEFITAGVISTPPSDPTPRRLLTLREDIRELIAEFSPDAVAVERVLFQANVSTAMGVGQASGVALTEAEDYGCEIAEYSPNQIKLAVAGHGGADKGEIARMIKLLLGSCRTAQTCRRSRCSGYRSVPSGFCHEPHCCRPPNSFYESLTQ